MRRLCQERSRSYLGRSVQRAVIADKDKETRRPVKEHSPLCPLM